jgi:hypothetical protein
MTTGGRYIGQSKSLWERVASHFKPSGKLAQFGKLAEKFHSMPGSTPLQREVYEQYLISSADGGIDALINIRNPMGGRMDKYEAMIEDVIREFNLR